MDDYEKHQEALRGIAEIVRELTGHPHPRVILGWEGGPKDGPWAEEELRWVLRKGEETLVILVTAPVSESGRKI